MLSTCIAQNERISVFLNTEIPKSYNVWSGTALPQVGPPCHFKLRPCCLAPPLNETDKTYVVSEEVLWGSSTTSSLWKQHKQTRSIQPLNVGTVSRATMVVINAARILEWSKAVQVKTWCIDFSCHRRASSQNKGACRRLCNTGAHQQRSWC